MTGVFCDTVVVGGALCVKLGGIRTFVVFGIRGSLSMACDLESRSLRAFSAICLKEQTIYILIPFKLQTENQGFQLFEDSVNVHLPKMIIIFHCLIEIKCSRIT